MQRIASRGAPRTIPEASVLVVAPTPPPFHGVAVAMRSLLQGCPVERVRLVHLDITDRRGITHVDQPDLYDVYLFCRQWFSMAWLLIRQRPRVVYLAISQSTIGFLRDALFLTLAWLFRRRIVVHLHGGNFAVWYAGRGRPMRSVIDATLARVTKFVVLGETFRKSLDPLIAPEKIVVVPNGIPWRHRVSLRDAAGARVRVLFLSTLSREKGALVLLEAAARLARERRDVEFVLAGPWLRAADRAIATRLIAEHALEGLVSFPGQVDGQAKADLYDTADVFVFPGLQQEGQPLVVLEAMAAGLPVVFCDRGCLAETLLPGEAGVEFALGDPKDLAARLQGLIEHPLERLRLGANARRRYEEAYSEDRFISNMTRVFIEAAQGTA